MRRNDDPQFPQQFLTRMLLGTGISRTSGYLEGDFLSTQFLLKCYTVEKKASSYI